MIRNNKGIKIMDREKPTGGLFTAVEANGTYNGLDATHIHVRKNRKRNKWCRFSPNRRREPRAKH
jgi:hypothetical protein